MLKGAPNGKWRERCDTCKPKYDAKMAARGNRQRLTGVTPEEYEALLKEQKGLCAICKRGPIPPKVLSADHDHKTLRTRGLLCGLCNMGIGAFNDDVSIMKNAISYLDKHKQMSLFLPSAKRNETRNRRSGASLGNRDPQMSVYGSTRRNLRACERRRNAGSKHD